MKRETGFTNSAKFRCLGNLQNNSVDLGLVECGMEECEPGYRFGYNGKGIYLLHVVVKGKGKLGMNQKVYPVSCGEAFLICPDEEAWYEADMEEPWFYIWVRFTGLKAYECVTGAGFKKEAPVHRVYCINALKECVEKMLEAHQLTYSDELKRNGELMLFFSALIADYHQNILKGGYNKRVYPGVVYVKYAMEYICNGVQREHNKKLNNGLPILHKVPPKRDYGRYFCILAEKGGTSHGGLTEKLSPFFYAQKQEVNAYGR